MRALIDAGAVDVEFQPIWDLSGTRVLGYEALARPRSSELSGPGEAFEIADSIGRGHELDAVCRRATLRVASELPQGALLFLNVSPADARARRARGRQPACWPCAAPASSPHQVVLEITERTDARKEILIPEAARLRALGFLLALDDVGAGNAGLEMLRALPVDFIKIDRAVVASAVEDRSARAVLLGDHGLRARERLVRDRRGDRDRGDAGAGARPQPRRRGARDRRPGRAGLPARPAGARADRGAELHHDARDALRS